MGYFFTSFELFFVLASGLSFSSITYIGTIEFKAFTPVFSIWEWLSSRKCLLQFFYLDD